ncbi:MAG: hypothetical protein HY420_02690 [Candidatus Kerfeldbacteria bacterium]|nr:hypothetical protein [Candidatus Kerfeldbacteria bacterium]
MNLKLPSRKKIWEWIRRYAPQELVALLFALYAANMLRPLFLDGRFSWSKIAAAYVVTVADAIAYYGYALVRELLIHRHNHARGIRAFALAFRDVVLEYSAADTIDTVVTRPFFMFWAPRLVGSINLGIIIGQVLAGATFYLMVVPAYEWRKRHIK